MSVGFVEGNIGCRSRVHRVVDLPKGVNVGPKGETFAIEIEVIYSQYNIGGRLKRSLTPPVDGNAFIHCVIILVLTPPTIGTVDECITIHCVITLVRDLVIIFGKLMKGSEWQMVLPRSLIVRIGCSILGTCSSAEQMCIVAGRMADLMSSTSNSLSPKMSEIMKPLDECIFKIFRRIRMIFSFFLFSRGSIVMKLIVSERETKKRTLLI